ncbi:PAS domain-containing protein [Syntrophomonas palmitatica]|uniref:PAS domain-containing protein n=1 Tax=Syntrophomonas palmitatica TaxID=402877 RepID=UPI0006D1C791|nr:PAS domain-containing protein [Syntrophomonas palmitatica]
MSKRDPSTAFICLQTPNDILSYCAAFLEKTSDGVLLIDEDGQIIFWNRAMETIFAIKSSEALGVKAWDIHTLLANQSFENEDIIDKIRTDITRALHSGEANWMKGTLEQEIIDRNSQQRYVQFSFFPIETVRGFMIVYST